MKIMLIAGMVLFLIGLLNGLFIPSFESHHMSQTAHLVGIQNAVVLIVFGLIVKHINFSTKFTSLLITLSIYSMYAIWLSVALTATSMTDVDNFTPVLIQNIATIFLYSGSLAIILATIIIITGLIRE